jgi:transposase
MNNLNIKDLDHLGIVAGIIDEMGLVEIIDEEVGTHPQEKLSVGTIVKAMILNCLGCINAPLYLFSEFFKGKALEHLLGEGIKAEDLNDDKLGRYLAAFRRRTNTYAKSVVGLQRVLDIFWMVHNFVRSHFTTKKFLR